MKSVVNKGTKSSMRDNNDDAADTGQDEPREVKSYQRKTPGVKIMFTSK